VNLCIIPARAGSKRIKDKNIREFCGKPIIEYAIDAALESKMFDMIVLYTNIEELFIWNNKSGITRLKRTAKSSGDNKTLSETLIEVLTLLDSKYGWFNNICLLLPTAVFTTSEDLIKSFEMLKDNDAVVAVKESEYPIERAFMIDTFKNQLHMRQPMYEFTRTQDLPQSYYDAGQFYWLNTKAFLEQKRIFMDKTVPYIMDAIDIDTESDWIKAEAIYEHTRILAR
jgi:pseudaminic acid cytidylyltransferase